MIDVKFSIFKELYNTDVPYTVTLEKVINRIKEGTSKDKVEKIRNGVNDLKTKLPCIVFSGVFSQRNKKGLLEHSGLMVLDFDKIKDPVSYKNVLKKNKHFVLLFISPSGNGVKGVIKIPKCNEVDHTKYFKAFEKEFNLDYLDAGGSNVDRVCFESYDPDIYINLNAELFSPELIDEGFVFSEKVPLIPINDNDVIISKIMKFNWNKNYIKGERNSYLFDLAGAFCEYGVSENYSLNFINNHIALDDISEREVINTVKSAYKLRDFHSKYFEDYNKKNKIISDLKYDKQDVISSNNIDEETYEKISKDSSNVTFWYYDKKKNIKIDAFKYKIFLENNGFRKYFPNDVLKPQLVRVESNKVEDTSVEILRDFVLEWLLEKEEFDVWKRCVNYQNLFSDNYISMLGTIDLMMLKDKRDKSYIAFNNGILEVTKDSAKLMDFIDISGYIWKKQIINRDFIASEKIDNDYKSFIFNISNKEPEAIEAVIGYLLSCYKNKINNKAIILNDEVISDSPEGGTGKGLFIQGIKQIRRTAILDGKSFDDKKSFPYQTVSQDTHILVFDDVKKNFDFENKFSLVTEGLTLERKNKDAIKLTIEESPKLVISTNYAIKGEGNSHDRRRHEIEFAQYYGRDKDPYNEFGRELFDDWNGDDWIAFDNYMIGCLQTFFKLGLIQQNAKNIKLRKLIAETAMEFYEWASDSQNLTLNERNDKSVFFGKFIEEYPDYKKWLTRKRFNIWVKKYAIYSDKQYNEGNSNGVRWFELSSEENNINDDLPF